MPSIRQLARTHGLNFSTLHRRIKYYGYTLDEAINCPSGTPLWLYRIEQDEGMPLVELLRGAAATAKQTGYTLADMAREWGVAHHTLQHWSTKYGITWPRGVSALQRETAARLAHEINERRRAA